MKKRILSFLLVLCLFLSSNMTLFANAAVAPIIIENFNIAFQSGAVNQGGQWVWSPEDPASGHMFVYRLDYAISGTFSQGKGSLRIELPAHILKDRNGNWADSFDCSYKKESELSDGAEPDFVYKVEGDKVVIYNYKDYPTGTAGYIEFAYVTSKSTMDYIDRGQSTVVPGTIYCTNDNSTVSKQAQGPAVLIDTHAVLESVSKGIPELHKTWDNSWGTKPSDADNWYYLTWCVTSDVGKNTQPYDFSIADTFSSLGGSVVGYKFSGQSKYSTDTVIKNQRNYGKRYDYVLTRHSKSQAQALLNSQGRYEVVNNVKSTVTPVDKIDPSTTKAASRSWWFEVPKFIHPTGHFWTEKYGVWGGSRTVMSSEDISNYMLEEFQLGDIDSLDELKYYVYIEGFPYPWTLGAGADGTVADALNDRYGKKKVDYELVDDLFYLEDETSPLSQDQYDVTGMEWYQTIRDATFDREELKYYESGISEYKDADNISVFVKVNNSWARAFVYEMKSKSYINVDDRYVESARGSNVVFKSGVKGIKVTCSNAYYHTKIDVYPIVSLFRTDYTLGQLGEATGKTKGKLTNQATGNVTQSGSTLFTRTVQGTDYVCRALKESELTKDIVQTKNDKVAQKYILTWRSSVHEDLIGGDVETGILQESGKFYDLLPVGGIIDKSSIEVKASNQVLSEGSYDVEFVENYNNSGRTLMIVSINTSTDRYYDVKYSTVHSWDSIKDYGKNVRNSVMYESGNKRFTGGLTNNGGQITDKSILNGTGSSDPVHLYAEAHYEMDLLMAGSTGLMKQVRGPYDSSYSYETITNLNGSYSYQIRHENDTASSSKDMIFFDSLESFYQKETETSETIESEWKGVLESIDITQMQKKGVKPVVYLSKIDRMNIYSHHDLNEVMNGEKVWIEYNEFLKKYKLSDVHAIAVDARKSVSNRDFVLGAGESVVFTLHMRAPERNPSQELEPITYNNIYINRSLIKNNGTTLSQFFHQDYTQVKFRVTGDVNFKKVDKIDMESPVKGATFLLRGTSEYGTEYDETRTSDKSGLIRFKDIEVGTYELMEVESDPDWQLNKTVYTVTVGVDGSVVINCDIKNDQYVIADSPRVHASMTLIKTDIETGDVLNGAKFRLSGTSAYGNDILLYAESQKVNGVDGRVVFDDIEMGTYKLSEIEAPYGYLLDKVGWTVEVNDSGVLTVTRGDEVLERNVFGYYELENEKSHSIRFLKSSSYGDNVYLSGAKFSLAGVSDSGTEVDLTAVSASESDGGLVVFDDLESGTYILKEIEAPDGHELDGSNHVVHVNRDGTFEIEGVGVSQFGNADVYDFKNVKKSGVVKVIKWWDDDSTNEERPWPDIVISTNKPSKNKLGVTVTYDANGGVFGEGDVVNEVTYTSSGSIVAGQYKSVSAGVEEYRSFLGWYDSEQGGNKVEIDNSGKPNIGLGSDVTLYAHWKTSSRYAVCVWDIGVDIDKDGRTMGITFGPALGFDSVHGYKSHSPSGVTANGHEHRCLHNDSWSDVVDWNILDPWVYEDCILEGCTKSVPLNMSGLNGGRDQVYDGMTGDGVNVLNFELGTQENRWWNGNNTATNTWPNTGGWGGSRVRAMMNGADELTNSYAANGISTDTGSAMNDVMLYNEDNCLFNCFPEVLQRAIGVRAVKYDSVAGKANLTSANCKTSYDKLWAPSAMEIGSRYVWTGSGNLVEDWNHVLEGTPYRKWRHKGVIIWQEHQAIHSDLIGYHCWYSTPGYVGWSSRSFAQTQNQIVSIWNTDNTIGWFGAAYPDAMRTLVCFTLSR